MLEDAEAKELVGGLRNSRLWAVPRRTGWSSEVSSRYKAAQVRVLKDALEARWKREIATEECVVPWIVERAAHTLNRFEVGKASRTAFERRKGKTARRLGIEFGEAVLWRRKPVGGALREVIRSVVVWRVSWSEGSQ